MGKITLTNIVEELAARSGMNKEVTDNFVRAIVDTIEKGLQEDNLVKIKGLGTFKLMEMSDRGSVDINTGERITIKGYRKVTFTPDSAMKEFVNRPFAHFEPTELNEGYPSDEEEQEGVENEDLVNASTDVVEQQESSVDMLVAETDIPSESEASLEAKSDEEEMVETVEEADNQFATTEELLPEEPVENVEIPVVEVKQEESLKQEMKSMENIVHVEAVENNEDEGSQPQPIDENNTTNTVSSESSTIESEVIKDNQSKSIEDGYSEPSVDTSGNASSSTEIEESEVFKQEGIFSVASEEPITAPDMEGVESNTTSKRRESNRNGCGWFVIILLIGFAYGVYYLMTVDKEAFLSNYDDKIEEYNDMMVNPNLEEELGEEWGDEPKMGTQLPTEKQEKAEEQIVEKAENTKNVEQTKNEETSAQSENVPVVGQSVSAKPSSQSKFCTVTPTESLEAKTIKDITPADTTDYAIEGTLLTHELKNGETIIQLAKKYYGDKRLWPYIVKYNWMKDYNNVAIGQMINIPVLKDKAQ